MRNHGGGGGLGTLPMAPRLCFLQGLRSTHFLEDGHFQLNIEVEGGHNLMRKMKGFTDTDTNSLVSGSDGSQNPWWRACHTVPYTCLTFSQSPDHSVKQILFLSRPFTQEAPG